MNVRHNLSCLLGVLIAPTILGAQSPACEGQGSTVSPEVESTKITIVSVTFRGENPLSEEDRDHLTKEIRHAKIHASAEDPDEKWVSEAGETVKGSLQDRGYFRALVEIKPYLVRAEAHERFYAIDVEIDSGKQYRLGEIQISNGTVFSTSDLRKQVALGEAEIFDVSKVREGLEAIGTLYGTKGYIDAVVEPEEKIQESKGQIDLVLRLDEGPQYHIGTVESAGLDARAEADARSVFEPGKVFDKRLWEDFFQRNKSALPDGAPDRHASIRRDTRNGTVDIVLDFEPCSSARSK